MIHFEPGVAFRMSLPHAAKTTTTRTIPARTMCAGYHGERRWVKRPQPFATFAEAPPNAAAKNSGLLVGVAGLAI